MLASVNDTQEQADIIRFNGLLLYSLIIYFL